MILCFLKTIFYEIVTRNNTEVYGLFELKLMGFRTYNQFLNSTHVSRPCSLTIKHPFRCLQRILTPKCRKRSPIKESQGWTLDRT